MEVWFSIVSLLRVPHFSFINRMGLQHEDSFPLILGTIVQPKLSLTGSMYLHHDPRPCHVQPINYSVCSTCYEDMFHHNERLGMIVCGHCGDQKPFQESFHYKPFSRARVLPRQMSDDFYKRTIYFREWLKRLQAKERCVVTTDQIELIKTALENRAVNYWTIKKALKQLRLQRFYDHIIFILKLIRGRPLFLMSCQQEDILVRMFYCIRDSFLSLAEKRTNMFSYPYLIAKFCELNQWFKVAKIIPLLKSPSRIKKQDELWYIICQQTGWTFTPTPLAM